MQSMSSRASSWTLMEDFFVQECCVHGTDLENHGPTSILCDDPLPIESNIQLIGSPTSDPKIFSWKSVRDHQTCPKIGFRGSRYLKRGPIQGVLDFFKNWKKIHQYLKCGLEPQILGRASSVIPFWKALAIPIAGPYSKLSSQP